MILLLFVPPALLAILLAIFRAPIINRIALIAYGLYFMFAVLLFSFGETFFIFPESVTHYFTIDPISKLFLLILGAVNLCVSLYAVGYWNEKKLERNNDTLAAVFHILFIASMAGGITCSHLALAWVFIEATTLCGAVLIALERERTALEAVWKYIFVCSIGVSLSFIGIVLFSMGGHTSGSLFYSDLVERASEMNPFLLRLSFVFILVGFGTKMGLAPVHAWLPDAHSEAPAPVSALLSGVLLNASVVALIRFQPIMVGGGQSGFASALFIFMGICSILLGAAFVPTVKNFKRMLAYSSIENMGIISIGIGIGTPAILFAVLLQSAVHSLAKSGLFLTSGNIYRLFHTKHIEDVKGLISRDRLTGILWIAGFIALSGLPPFAGFWSKLFFARSLLDGGHIALFITVFLLFIVITGGMGRTVLRMTLTRSEPHHQETGKPPLVLSYLPQIILLSLLLAGGIFIPDPIKNIIDQAVRFITTRGGSAG